MTGSAARRQDRATAVKVAIYAAVMLLILGALIVVFSNFRSGDTKSYSAIFTDASGLKSGQNVRVAGVLAGKVSSVSLRRDATVKVTFNVSSARPLDTATRVAIKYENLTGDRYLEISNGAGSRPEPLTSGATIPTSRTSPALDIDTLIGGLRPLFSSVSGSDVNTLTSSLIDVLQGQGQTVELLLQHAGSISNTLADQDSVIGQVIDNFNQVLGTVDQHRDALSDSIEAFGQLADQIAKLPDPIGNITTHLDQATQAAVGLITDIRPDVTAGVTQIDRLAGTLDSGRDELRRVISQLPAAYQRLARMGAYGSVFQLYACEGTLRLTDPQGQNIDIPLVNQTTGRCAP